MNERVTLTELEEVSIRGDRTISWWIDDKGKWCAARTWPNAEVARANASQGTIWQQEIAVLLPIGVELLRVERRPRRESVRDPLEYLTGAPAPAFEVIRQVFRVERGGRLVPHSSPKPPAAPSGNGP